MRLRFCALAILAFGASGLAQAEAVYSANFSLTGAGLSGLATGTGMDAPGTAYPGSWTSANRVDTVLNTQDFLGYTADPVSGDQSPVWGNPGHSDNMHRSSGAPLQLGQTNATIYSALNETYGSGYVAGNRLGASIKLQDDGGKGTGYATWERNFSLNAHSSFTFAGLANLGITDPLNAPLDASTTFSSSQTFASLSLTDAAARVSTSISASLAGLSGLFSYATDPNGLLSLTITNNLDTAINGTLKAGSYVNVLSLPGSASLSVASPVPEPSTYLTMLLGLGIVGAVARKKLPKQAFQAPALAC